MNLVNLHDLKPSFIEAGSVIDKKNALFRKYSPEGASGGYLPDEQRVFPADRPISGARELWECFRDHWKVIQGFAHSHPGDFTDPSWVDITTFAVIELGLDMRFDWWIVTARRVSLVRWQGPDVHNYSVELLEKKPTWAEELYARSRRTQIMA
jgi:hypothetical protein